MNAASRALARYGFACYLPKYKTRHQRVALLFPSYIFAGPVEEWVALRRIYGVSKLLRRGDEQLATVPDTAVAALRAREDPQGFIKLPAKAVRSSSDSRSHPSAACRRARSVTSGWLRASVFRRSRHRRYTSKSALWIVRARGSVRNLCRAQVFSEWTPHNSLRIAHT